MKAVHTLYLGQDKTARFNSVSDMLASTELSARLAKKHFGRIELYTNAEGKELVNGFANVYDKIHLSHTSEIIPEGWTYSKILTYSLQKEPFIHLDNDVFLFDPLPEDILNTDVFFQNVEALTKECHHFYWHTAKEFKTELADIQPICPAYAINTGVLGCNNLKFIKSYAKEAKKLYSRIAEHCYTSDFTRIHIPILMEQQLIVSHLADLDVKFLFNEDFEANYAGLKYTHLIADSKRNPKLIDLVHNRLKELQ